MNTKTVNNLRIYNPFNYELLPITCVLKMILDALLNCVKDWK